MSDSHKPAQTLQELAQEASSWFTGKERPNGDKIRVLKDGRPEWVLDLVREAHDQGNRLPDDYTYEFTESALDIISEASDEQIEDSDFHEQIDSAVDVYTSNLQAWLAAGNSQYCEEAVKDGLISVSEKDFDMDRLLMCGQYEHRSQVLYSVLSSLKERFEDDTEEELCEACFVPLSVCICAPKEPVKPEEVHFQQAGQPSACGSMSGSFNSDMAYVTCRACYEKREAERDFMDYHRARQAEEVALETQADQSPNTEEN